VHKSISPEVYLITLNFDGKNRLTVRGVSDSMSEVFRLVSALEDSNYFKNVKTKYATKSKVEGRELTDFEITCPLE